MPRREALTPERIAAIRSVALSEPLLVNRLISPDARTTGVNVTLTLPGESEAEVPTAMAAAREMIAAFEAANPEIIVATTGLVALNNAFSEASFVDLSTPDSHHVRHHRRRPADLPALGGPVRW